MNRSRYMKTALIISSLSILLFTGCESTDDVLKHLDHTVPVIVFTSDTVEVTAGEKITINATVTDDSGIQRVEFSYGDWRINKIIDLTKEANTQSYLFSLDITVPADAAKEWEETKYFNDASSIKIVQQYHKLALSAWDRNRNMVKGNVYIRVK